MKVNMRRFLVCPGQPDSKPGAPNIHTQSRRCLSWSSEASTQCDRWLSDFAHTGHSSREAPRIMAEADRDTRICLAAFRSPVLGCDFLCE
jgi:hypothetical protein